VNRRYLKSEGRRSTRLHFSHSAWFLTLPFSKTVFILTSPPQEQKNFWVALEVRAFLLAWAISVLLTINSDFHRGYHKKAGNVNRKKRANGGKFRKADYFAGEVVIS
jgi:hypothetical protein